MKQKITKIGNSAGVILPKVMLQEWGLEVGQEVDIRFDGSSIRVGNAAKDQSSVLPRFVAMANEIMERNKSLYRKLAKS